MNTPALVLKNEYIYLLIFSLLAFLYYPILETYAITDAYEFFWNAKRNPDFIHVFIQGGRPLSGIAFSLFFNWTETISDLKYIRLVGFVGNLLLLFCFYSFLIKLKFKSTMLPLLFFLAASPFVAISMGWTALFQGGWAMLAALLSAQSILKGLDSTQDKKKLIPLALGVILGLVSLMLYQPAMTFFIFIVFLFYEKENILSRYIKSAGIYLLIFILYFLLFKLSLWLLDLPPLDRSGINLDLLYKIKWFFEKALWKSARLNLVLVKYSFQNIFRVFMILLFLVCIAKYLVKNGSSRSFVISAVIIFFTYFFAYLPNLASMENYLSDRSMGTLVLLNVYFLYKGIVYLINSNIVRRWVIAFFLLFFCIFGFINVRWGITKIHSTEYAVLYKSTEEILKENSQVRIITVLQPSANFLQEQKIVKRSGDEFGLLSNSQPWTTEPMFLGIIEDIARKEGYCKRSIQISICSSEQSNLCRNDGPLIDIESEFIRNYTKYY